MFERPHSGSRAVLVHCQRQIEAEDVEELRSLVESAGLRPVATLTMRRSEPDPKFCIGSGKLAELRCLASDSAAELVIFNQPLSPAQERNLERELALRVMDRTGLILEIFAQRAQSFEGKLQVELASLKHASTRLVRGWTHLERQQGGVGVRGGPGETQIELDRRMLSARIRQVQARLEKLAGQQRTRRQGRQRSDVPTVAVVGYTNAGKSTLFNALTQSRVYAADRLFATLDPTLRRWPLERGLHVVLADTVGFIRALPHELVAAFRTTLHEALEADLLLHVVDAASAVRGEMIEQVDAVLTEIGAGEVPVLQVYNKIDQLPGETPRIDRDAAGRALRVWISAVTGAGFDLLRTAVSERMRAGVVRRRLRLSPAQAGQRLRLMNVAHICWERMDEQGGWQMEIEIQPRNLGLLKDLHTVETAAEAG